MPSKRNQLKQSLIAHRKTMVDELCNHIYKLYKSNNNKIPHRTFTNIVEENKTSFPTLKVAMLSMAFCRYKKKRERQQTNDFVPNTNSTIPITNTVLNIDLQANSIPNTVFVNDEESNVTASTISNVSELADTLNDRNKGGRPKGTTLVEQKQLHLCVIAAKNEIAEEYKKRLQLAKEEGTYCKPKTLQKVIAAVTKKRNLPEDLLSVHAICKRITRGRECIAENCVRGLSSPLFAIDPAIVVIIL